MLGRGRTSPPAAPTPDAHEPAGAAPAPPPLVGPSATSAERRAATEHAPAPRLVPPARETREVWLEVVEEGSGRPIAGADVWFRSHVRDEDEARLERGEVAFEDVAEHATADADGRVRVRAVLYTEVYVAARKGTWMGATELDEVPGPDEEVAVPWARVELVDTSSDFDLDVLVLGAEGGPVEGVPVSLRLAGVECAEATTGRDGIGRLASVGLRCAEWAGKEIRVEAEILAREPVQAVLAALPPETPPVLRLPPVGAVRVDVVDADGAAVEDASRVALGIVDGRWRWARPSAGTARFDFVELGLEIRAQAGCGHQYDLAQARFAGPQVPSEEVRQELVLGAASPILQLRILGRAGKPLADKQVDLRYASENFRTWTVARTDANGCARLDVKDVPGDTRLCVVVEEWDGKPLAGRLEIDLPLPPGLQPVREVALELAPVLLAGVVLDAQGAPFVTTDEDYLELGLSPVGSGGGWHRAHSIDTDERGRFELRGGCAEDELWVRVKLWAAESERVRVLRGDTDLRLSLPPVAR